MAILLNFAKPIRLLCKATLLETPRNGHVCTWASPLRPTRLYDAPIMAAMEHPGNKLYKCGPPLDQVPTLAEGRQSTESIAKNTQ